MRIKYVDKRFRREALEVIDAANSILDEYQAQGFDLTLRQLYYQFVARALIANNQREYKRLGSIINDARLAGLVPWDRLVDRTRNLQGNNHWRSVGSIIRACADQYRIDTWEGQKRRVEVWIEKDALVGVIEQVCRTNDVQWFSCRGYVSQSEMWSAGQRILERDVPTIILHLGDHDPSGIDMTRDIQDRLQLFCGDGWADVRRIALTEAQVRQYNPPPNPAKITDSRAADYIARYGHESWELDALSPQVLSGLIQDHVDRICDRREWDARWDLQQQGRARLAEIAKQEG